MSQQLGSFTYAFRPASRPGSPVLLLLHGTGGDERQLLEIGELLAPDAPLLAPRGQLVEGDGVPRFFRRIPTGDGSAYPFTFDPDEVVAQVAELAGFVDEAIDRHDLAGRPVVATGFSNGANAGVVLLLTHPGLLRGAVLVAPMPVLDEPPSPDLSGNAVLLASGRADPIATPEGVEALAGTLAERRASVTLHWHEGGHEFGRSPLDAARAWLDKLRKATAADPLP